MENIEKLINQYKYKHIFDMAKKAGDLGLKEGLKVYIVGGVVRDLLLGRDVQDLDLMVEGELKAYEKLKDMTRGEKVDAESITKFIESLTLSDEHKKTLLKLSPGSYVGMASNIVDQL